MTANSPPQTKAASLIDALKDLIVHMKALDSQLGKVDTNLGKYYKKSALDRSVKGAGSLLGGALGGVGATYLPITNMKKMEDLQKRSVVIGTSANKLSILNTKTMQDLKANTYTKLEERMDLFADGFRDNNDELIKLAVRMRVTGQGTEMLRRVMATMNSVAGLNNDQIGALSKTIVDYGNKYAVSNEKILMGLNDLTETLSTANLAGLGDKFANFGAAMTAKFPTMQNFSKVIAALTDFNKIADFSIAGLNQGDLLKIITSNMQLDDKMDKFVDSMKNFRSPTSGQDIRIAKIFSDNFNTLGPLAEMANIMKSNENTQNVLAEKEDRYFATFENTANRANDYYTYAMDAYDVLMRNTDKMYAAMVAGQVGGGIGSILGGLMAKSALGAVAGGPIGAAVGLALGAAGIISMMNTKGPLPGIEKNTRKTADILDKVHNSTSDQSLGGTMSAIMMDAIGDVITHQDSPDSTPVEQLEVLKEIRDFFKKSVASPSVNGGGYITLGR